MIKSFGDKETEWIWKGEYSKRFPANIQPITRRKLRMINNAQEITDLRIPPGNRLEKFKGDFTHYWGIRVNNQWRIIFQWKTNDAFEVQLVDYHK